MKIKLIFALILLVLILLVIRICSQTPAEGVDLSKALIISTYVYPIDVTDPQDAKHESISCNLEPLELNQRRYLEISPSGLTNINFCFNFEGGVVELINDARDVQMSTGTEARPYSAYDDPWEHKYADRLSVSDGGYIAIVPLGSGTGTRIYDFQTENFWDKSPGYVGRKYYLTVNAYDFFDINSPIITAELELIQLADDRFPNGTGSHFYSIELISYEYSDTYKLMENHK